MSNEPSYLTKGPDAALMRLLKGLTHDVTNRRLIILLVALVACLYFEWGVTEFASSLTGRAWPSRIARARATSRAA